MGGGGSLTAVAKRRFWGMREGRDSRIAEDKRRRAGGRRAAIVSEGVEFKKSKKV